MLTDKEYINDLAKEVRLDSGNCIDDMARSTDMATQSIVDYELGNQSVSLKYFRNLIAKTGDLRLLQWLIPSAESMADGKLIFVCTCKECVNARRTFGKMVPIESIESASSESSTADDAPLTPPQPTPKRIPPADAKDLIDREIATIKKIQTALFYMKSVADGKVIDESDNKAITHLAELHDDLIATVNSVDRALHRIIESRKTSTKTKE